MEERGKPFADVQASFNRSLLRNRELIGRFYEILLASHPAMPEKFAHTDFAQQMRLLRHGILHAIGFARSSVSGEHNVARLKLRDLRISHDRHHLAIEPPLYDHWIESLVQTLAETDPEWSSGLEASWRRAMRIAVDYIREGY